MRVKNVTYRVREDIGRRYIVEAKSGRKWRFVGTPFFANTVGECVADDLKTQELILELKPILEREKAPRK